MAYPLYEALDTFLYTPGQVTSGPSHIRDGIDLKRMMSTVVVALLPCIVMAMWNTGHQANQAIAALGITTDGAANWRYSIIDALGIGYDSANIVANLLHGALYFIPAYLVTNIVGGTWEVIFSTIRKHEVNEGFLVTGLPVSTNTSAKYSSVASRRWNQLRSRHRQRSLRWHGTKLPEPGSDRSSVSLLRLPNDLRR